jgi:hypothetical protein
MVRELALQQDLLQVSSLPSHYHSTIAAYSLSPLTEVYNSPEQTTHYHILGL